jgi:hypothetical protein
MKGGGEVGCAGTCVDHGVVREHCDSSRVDSGDSDSSTVDSEDSDKFLLIKSVSGTALVIDVM